MVILSLRSRTRLGFVVTSMNRCCRSSSTSNMMSSVFFMMLLIMLVWLLRAFMSRWRFGSDRSWLVSSLWYMWARLHAILRSWRVFWKDCLCFLDPSFWPWTRWIRCLSQVFQLSPCLVWLGRGFLVFPRPVWSTSSREVGYCL